MLLGNVDGYVGLSLEVDQNLPLRAKHLVRLRGDEERQAFILRTAHFNSSAGVVHNGVQF